MAFADWDIAIGSGHAQALLPNNALANPLTDTGPDLRWINAGTVIGTWRTQFTLKSTAAGGVFYGSAAGSKISMTAWLRCNGGTQNGGAVKWGGGYLLTRHTINSDNGYYLGLGDGHGSTQFGVSGDGPGTAYRFCLALVMKNGGSIKVVQLRDELGTGSADSVVVNRNRWYRIRMDVIGTGGGDTIKVYVDDSGGGSPGTVVTGSEVWKLLHTESVVTGYRGFDPAHRNGWYMIGQQFVSPGAQGPHTYIDAFKIRKEAI